MSLLKAYYVVAILFCISGCIGQNTTKQGKQVELCNDEHILFPKDVKPYTGNHHRIIGGYVATPHMFPYQVAMHATGPKGTFFCGGSLITAEYVLTAAHCLVNITRVDVFLGVHDFGNREPSKVTIKGAKLIIHELYVDNRFDHDIGLILLSEKANLNEYINIIDIDDGDDLHTGETAICSGWGKTIWASENSLLRYTDLTIIPISECDKRFSTKIYETHICGLGKYIEGSGSGDSGGPLVINDIQVGIVSFGANLCYPLYPSVFTRVSKYSSWIYKKSGKDPKSKKGRGGRPAPLMEAWLGIASCLIFVNYL